MDIGQWFSQFTGDFDQDLAKMHGWVKDGSLNLEEFTKIINIIVESSQAEDVAEIAADYIYCQDESHAEMHYNQLAEAVDVWLENDEFEDMDACRSKSLSN